MWVISSLTLRESHIYKYIYNYNISIHIPAKGKAGKECLLKSAYNRNRDMLELPWRVSCLVVDFKSFGGFVFLIVHSNKMGKMNQFYFDKQVFFKWVGKDLVSVRHFTPFVEEKAPQNREIEASSN